MTAHGWEYERPNPQVVADAPPYWIIADGELRVADVKQQAGETEANARLIASAPDLLAACRGVDVLYSELHSAMPAIANTPAYDSVINAVKQARAAIAKAIGGNQ